LWLVFAPAIDPKVLEKVALTCSPDCSYSGIAICFGTAYLRVSRRQSSRLAPFSPACLSSESRFSEHALAKQCPLQILFSATFFVSVGMLLDLRFWYITIVRPRGNRRGACH